MSLFFDLEQSTQIRQAQNDATNARGRADQVAARVDELERRADRLALACQALWEILRTEHGMTDEQIRDKMGEIDLRDGVADGRITGQVTNCVNCRRPIRTTRPKCLYCGHTTPTDQIVH